MNPTSLSQSLLKGKASQLCSAGDAVEFIQPWYTPIETTPDSTGMAIGGIGSSYTLTAAGTTPVISFVPGFHVTHPETGAIALQDWFASERLANKCPKIEVDVFSSFSVVVDFYPLFDSANKDLFSGITDLEEISAILEKCQKNENFYKENEEGFKAYKTEFSPRTLELLKNNAGSTEANTAILLDHFSGSVKLKTEWSGSLIGDIEEDNRFGQATYPSENIENQLLYPQGELSYSNPAHKVSVKRKHYSPIVRNDLKTCALPSNFIEFELENTSSETRIFTLAWAQENLAGFSVIKKRSGVQDAGFLLQKTARHQVNQAIISDDFKGISLSQKEAYGDLNGQLAFGLLEASQGANLSLTLRPTIYSSNLKGSIEEALNTGRVNSNFDKGVYSGREALAGLISAEVELKAGEKVTLKFGQIIDFPEISMPGYKSSKRYTADFSESKETRLKELLSATAKTGKTLLAQIEADQKTLIDLFDNHKDLKSKHTKQQLVTMAQNTLSFLADATVWDKDNRFLVRECADYPFFNSLDVYFYGSFGMMWLSPELDTATMRYFSEAVLNKEDTERRFWIFVNAPTAKLPSKKYVGPRATKGAVIHDLGSPFDPKPDAYDWHNVAEWKDLAPKYILMMLRNYTFTKNTDLLKECWPAVESSIEYLINMIPKDHHMPLTTGTDDTFDNLSSFGITLYCGSLWVAGLRAALKITELIGVSSWNEKLNALAESALKDLNAALWDKNEKFLHFFSFPVIEDFIANQNPSKDLFSKLKVESTQSLIQDLNQFIYSEDYDVSEYKTEKVLALLTKENLEIKDNTFNASKLIRKAYLISECEGLLNEKALVLLERESDDSFGDPLLADTYLEMMNLETVLSPEQQKGIIEKAYKTNFVANSPHVGYANLTANDGSPKEAFQAQDVWIGVQYSNLAALQLAGETEKYEHLVDTLYENLYLKSKVPFAAPEGFNSSCTLSEADLDLDLLNKFKALGWILEDGRISQEFPVKFEVFSEKAGLSLDVEASKKLHRQIVTTGLKYTAGRYFRPGMVFALPLLMK